MQTQTATVVKAPRETSFSKSLVTKDGIILQENVVYSSIEYDKFTHFKANRKVDEKKVNNIVASMDEGRFLIAPILVNENLKIVDGQHRHAAVKILGLPLYFIIRIGLTEADIAPLNTNKKNWKSVDYLCSYIEQGKPEYIKLKQFMDENRLTLPQAQIMQSGLLDFRGRKDLKRVNDGKTRFTQDFKDGDFKPLAGAFSDDTVRKYREVMDAFDKQNPAMYLFVHKLEDLTRALLKFIEHPNYVHERMMLSFKGDINMLLTRAFSNKNYDDFYKGFERVYNIRKSKNEKFN